MRDPGEKGESFKVVIFVIKSFVLDAKLMASSMVLFSSFCVAYFGKKINFTYGHFLSFSMI